MSRVVAAGAAVLIGAMGLVAVVAPPMGPVSASPTTTGDATRVPAASGDLPEVRIGDVYFGKATSATILPEEVRAAASHRGLATALRAHMEATNNLDGVAVAYGVNSDEGTVGIHVTQMLSDEAARRLDAAIPVPVKVTQNHVRAERTSTRFNDLTPYAGGARANRGSPDVSQS